MNRGDILREKRKMKGCTQAVAAKGTKVALRSYVSYENGKEPRDKMFWARAAKFFDCDVEDFGVSISEDDAYDSYYRARSRDNTTKVALTTVGSTLLGFTIGGPPLAIVSLSLALASYTAGRYVGRKDALKKAAEENEALQEIIENHNRFTRSAKGIIYLALIERGIQPKPVEPPEDTAVPWPDEVIEVDSGTIKNWWLCFEEGVVDKGDPNANLENEIRADELLARFWNFAPDPSRKASVVVEDESLFEKLVKEKGGSYRGNLSAILVDTEEARLVREEYLTTYEEGADEEKLMRIVRSPSENGE